MKYLAKIGIITAHIFQISKIHFLFVLFVLVKLPATISTI